MKKFVWDMVLKLKHMNARALCVSACILFCVAEPGSVSADCTISATPLNFGEIVLPTTDPVPAEAFITVNCTGSVTYVIEVNEGNNPESPFYRRMSNKLSHTLRYELFQEVSSGVRWSSIGSGLEGSPKTATGTKGLPVQHAIYGVARPTTSTTIGNYTDVLVVIVNW